MEAQNPFPQNGSWRSPKRLLKPMDGNPKSIPPKMDLALAKKPLETYEREPKIHFPKNDLLALA